MRILLYLAAAALVIFMLMALIGFWLHLVEGRRVGEVLKRMDDKYDDYVRKRLTLHFLDEGDAQSPDGLTQDVMEVIEPEIQSLVAFSRSLKTPQIRYKSRFFGNLLTLTQQYCLSDLDKRELKPEDEQQFFAQAEAAIESDIRKRKVDLQLGNIS
jgi:hypothetical protein